MCAVLYAKFSVSVVLRRRCFRYGFGIEKSAFLHACCSLGATCTVGCAHSSPYQKLSCVGSSATHGQFYTQSLLRQKQFCTAKAHGFSTADLLCLKLFYSVVGFDRVLWQNICFFYTLVLQERRFAWLAVRTLRRIKNYLVSAVVPRTVFA